MEQTLNKMARDLSRNFSDLNRGGCGVVAYYTAVFFRIPRIVYLNRDNYRNLFIINGMNDGTHVSPAHAVVRISKDKCFDSDGVHEIETMKTKYGGRTWKIYNDRDLSPAKLHELIYESSQGFHLESDNLEYLKKIIKDKQVWNFNFDRRQIPGIRRMISRYSQAHFGKPQKRSWILRNAFA